jgi:hypothetical protein
MDLVRFGTGLMKNPHPDKKFFHFFEKILNGQAEDLSLSGYTESVCSQYRAVCLEFFHEIFRGAVEAEAEPQSGCSCDSWLTTDQTAISDRMSEKLVSALTSLEATFYR